MVILIFFFPIIRARLHVALSHIFQFYTILLSQIWPPTKKIGLKNCRHNFFIGTLGPAHDGKRTKFRIIFYITAPYLSVCSRSRTNQYRIFRTIYEFTQIFISPICLLQHLIDTTTIPYKKGLMERPFCLSKQGNVSGREMSSMRWNKLESGGLKAHTFHGWHVVLQWSLWCFVHTKLKCQLT